MMGRQTTDQARLFYEFHLEDRIPPNHLLRRINVFVTKALGDLHSELSCYYSHTGRPSVDPELMIRMLICRILLWHPLGTQTLRRNLFKSRL
jgi:transposase